MLFSLKYTFFFKSTYRGSKSQNMMQFLSPIIHFQSKQRKRVQMPILVNIDLDRYKVLFKSAILGSARTFLSLPFEHPFDTIKTNMQSRQQSATKTINYIILQKGWRGFYNGFSLNAVRVVSKAFFRWPLWISFTNFWNRTLNTHEMLRQSIIGFSISITELIAICPLQRLKIWMMTNNNMEKARFSVYLNSQASIRDLYKGMTPLLLKQTLSWTSFLVSSHYFKELARHILKKDHLNPIDIFLTSIPVSMVNTIFIMPADCIKTFYQEYSAKTKNKNFIEFCQQAKIKYGINGLYKGWNVRLLQYIIHSSFTLIVFEELMKQYDKA